MPQPTSSESAKKTAREEQKRNNLDDVSDDVTTKFRWTPECKELIPKFSLVRENRRTVEEWCMKTRAALQPCVGPQALIVGALANEVNFPEFNLSSFDKTDYTVESFLKLVQEEWNTSYKAREVRLVLTKRASETWMQILERLKSWCAETNIPVNDTWLMSQLRGNIEASQDVCKSSRVNPAQWVKMMDTQLGVYARQVVTSSSVQLVASDGEDKTADINDESYVEYMARTPSKSMTKKDHIFSTTGEPICDRCKKMGHIARNCPEKHFPGESIRTRG